MNASARGKPTPFREFPLQGSGTDFLLILSVSRGCSENGQGTRRDEVMGLGGRVD